MKISFGISPCPNDVYIYSGLISGEVEAPGLSITFDFQDVETLNKNAIKGVYDAAKISAAALPLVSGNYQLLNCGGALGRGCGPLLLVNGGEWDPNAPIMLPGVHTTANFLLDFFMEKAADKVYVPFDELYSRLRQTPGAQGVVIHECRFTYKNHKLTLVQDLGSFWESKTSCPIPLGVAVCKNENGLKELIEPVIRQSLHWAQNHEREALNLCGKYSQDMTREVMVSHIGLYVNKFTGDLGKEGHNALGQLLKFQTKA
jgi:1,4-dihydroxy-6-naphthoate synthase